MGIFSLAVAVGAVLILTGAGIAITVLLFQVIFDVVRSEVKYLLSKKAA